MEQLYIAAAVAAAVADDPAPAPRSFPSSDMTLNEESGVDPG